MRVVRFVGPKGCKEPAYQLALPGIDAALIDTLLGGGNVTLRLLVDQRPLNFIPTERVRDLLDFAASVYIADEIESRAKAPDHWSRSFQFLFPVDDPKAWAAAESVIQKALHTLSGDHYIFAWPKRSKLPKLGRKHRACLPSNYDVVCLFSGGLDSLLGAIQLLEAGKRVLLVGHQAESITASAQTELFNVLSAHYGDRVHLIQARVARSQGIAIRHPLPEKCEKTHRPRSFLFLGLAAAIASTANVNHICLPENGLISINPPLQRSRLGTLSTRTAHPWFLTEFSEFLDAIGVFSGHLWNPFLYQSKTDMLLGLAERLKDLALRSVSCAHAGDVRWIGKIGVRHCGYCVPCIYRRVAMIGAGWDNPDHYGFDVFRELSTLTPHKQADFRALVGFADRVVATTPAGRDLIVLSHGAFSPSVGERIGPHPVRDLSPWSEMLLRWAIDFLEKLGTLGSPSTLRIVGAKFPDRRARPT